MITQDPELLELQRLFNDRMEERDCEICHRVDCICDEAYEESKVIVVR